MTRVDLTQAFITYLDRAGTNPLEALEALYDADLPELGDIDLDAPSSVSISSTGITGRQGNISIEITGRGFAPASSFEAFSNALENGTARGTLTGIEVRDGATVVLDAALSGSLLTLSVGGKTVEIEGRFPTDLTDVLELAEAAGEFANEYDFVSPQDQAAYDAILARYDLSGMTFKDGGTDLLDIALGTDKVRVDLPQDLSLTFNGSFAGGLTGGLTSLGVVTSILGEGGFYDEDGITLRNMVISGAQDVPFFTLSGDFPEGGSLEDARLFVEGREMAYLELGSGAPGRARDVITAEDGNLGVVMAGFGGNDALTGTGVGDLILGGQGDDRLSGLAGNDTIYGGDGTDVIIGGAGNDLLIGGATDQDRRDVIYGGDGNDTIDGGYGNDELRGDAGDDVISGGFGADTVIGGAGNDTLTGSALGDHLFGGDGDDFINGGFGYDLINGGAGADEFFHLGIADHGSDWVQDYTAMDGDTLVFGNSNATRAQFQINEAFKETAGEADVAEAFVIYRPTGQIMWALVDGMGQDEINLRIGGETFDLMS